VLFIDARNYYTVVDRTLNEWSEWQLKNLNAIVWLHRGEIDKYKVLLKEYKDAIYHFTYESADKELDDFLFHYHSFGELSDSLKTYVEAKRKRSKELIESADKKDKKAVQTRWDDYFNWLSDLQNIVKEALWLYEKFGEGEYRDILGLCKCASRAEIAEKGYSLTPGAYVGVAPVEDDGVDFAERMKEIHSELLSLQAESNTLMETISKNMEELGV